MYLPRVCNTLSSKTANTNKSDGGVNPCEKRCRCNIRIQIDSIFYIIIFRCQSRNKKVPKLKGSRRAFAAVQVDFAEGDR